MHLIGLIRQDIFSRRKILQGNFRRSFSLGRSVYNTQIFARYRATGCAETGRYKVLQILSSDKSVRRLHQSVRLSLWKNQRVDRRTDI